MMDIEMTNHASVRKQQRGISADVLEFLLRFGKVCHDKQGAEVIHFDKRSKQRCESVLGKAQFRRVEGNLDVYAVRSLDGALLTVGHRSRRLPR